MIRPLPAIRCDIRSIALSEKSTFPPSHFHHINASTHQHINETPKTIENQGVTLGGFVEVLRSFVEPRVV
jgi:hypothetical protein